MLIRIYLYSIFTISYYCKHYNCHQQERNRVMPTGSASQRPVCHAKLLTNSSRPIASPLSVLSHEICVAISCFQQSPFATPQYSCVSLLPSALGKLFCYAQIAQCQLHPHSMFFTYFPTWHIRFPCSSRLSAFWVTSLHIVYLLLFISHPSLFSYAANLNHICHLSAFSVTCFTHCLYTIIYLATLSILVIYIIPTLEMYSIIDQPALTWLQRN